MTRKLWWSTMLAVAVCASPALAQAPESAPARDTKPAPAMQHSGEDDLQAFAALDFEDQDLLAAGLDDGPNQAPMGDDGPRMGGMHGTDGPHGMHGRMHPDGPGGGPGGAGGMHAHWAMMAEKLQLTDAQRDKIHDLMDAQMRRGIQERADIKIATLDLHKLMMADQPNKTTIDAQVDKLARMRATLAKERIGTMLQAHALLTPDQRAKLRTMHAGGGMHERGGEDGADPHGHGEH